jgi:hypothetical protein
LSCFKDQTTLSCDNSQRKAYCSSTKISGTWIFSSVKHQKKEMLLVFVPKAGSKQINKQHK